ncbi:hypothetical protein [Microbulbifer guangxiensis]|uniref:hypothetical protein n=1 Tax=Microbulbifer guangxiensis TaxID=2904249 RepID=UPI001F204AE8|nr:hypothetical protein [Microbulbifer guangxiensis]
MKEILEVRPMPYQRKRVLIATKPMATDLPFQRSPGHGNAVACRELTAGQFFSTARQNFFHAEIFHRPAIQHDDRQYHPLLLMP